MAVGAGDHQPVQHPRYIVRSARSLSVVRPDAGAAPPGIRSAARDGRTPGRGRCCGSGPPRVLRGRSGTGTMRRREYRAAEAIRLSRRPEDSTSSRRPIALMTRWTWRPPSRTFSTRQRYSQPPIFLTRTNVVGVLAHSWTPWQVNASSGTGDRIDSPFSTYNPVRTGDT
jgi:hypothetical protein